MQCACVILSSVACPSLQYFSTLPNKRHDFRKKKTVIEPKMYALIFSTTFFILKRIERNKIKMYIGLIIEGPVMLFRF